MEVPFETFVGFLEWLSGPSAGGFAILTWFASWLLEDFEFWHKLLPKTKSVIFYIGAIAMGVGGHLIAQNEQLVIAIEPYFKIVLAGTVVWLVSQAAHRVDKVTTYIGIEEPEEEPFG